MERGEAALVAGSVCAGSHAYTMYTHKHRKLMGWATQCRPRQCQFLTLELRRFGKIHHIIMLKPFVLFIRHLVVCSSEINFRHTD